MHSFSRQVGISSTVYSLGNKNTIFSHFMFLTNVRVSKNIELLANIKPILDMLTKRQKKGDFVDYNNILSHGVSGTCLSKNYFRHTASKGTYNVHTFKCIRNAKEINTDFPHIGSTYFIPLYMI